MGAACKFRAITTLSCDRRLLASVIVTSTANLVGLKRPVFSPSASSMRSIIAMAHYSLTACPDISADTLLKILPRVALTATTRARVSQR